MTQPFIAPHALVPRQTAQRTPAAPIGAEA
jgi:hypothetical protein